MGINTKYRLGKLAGAGLFATNLSHFLSNQGFVGLPISITPAVMAGTLQIAHKHPIDRLLIAQSLLENCAFASNEAPFDSFGVNRIW